MHGISSGHLRILSQIFIRFRLENLALYSLFDKPDVIYLCSSSRLPIWLKIRYLDFGKEHKDAIRMQASIHATVAVLKSGKSYRNILVDISFT